MFINGKDQSIRRLADKKQRTPLRHLVPENLRKLRRGLSGQLEQLRSVNVMLKGIYQVASS